MKASHEQPTYTDGWVRERDDDARAIAAVV